MPKPRALKGGLLLTCFAMLIELSGSEAYALSPLDEWNHAARDSLPKPVKLWLGLMFSNNLAALAFVKNHIAARWVFSGFLISHAIVILILWPQNIPIMAGQVSLLHIVFWTPGFCCLLIKRRELRWLSAYTVWAVLSAIFYLGSMSIDIPDGLITINHFYS